MTLSTVPYAIVVEDDPIIMMETSYILEDAGFRVICPPLSGPETMIVWTTKGTTNAEQEAQAGRDHRQAA